MTNTTSQNPWQNLKPLYVLPEDFAAIAHHKNYSNLRLDMMPGQFIGGLDNAEVVFLLLNPGFNEDDIKDSLVKGFANDIQRNHVDPHGSSFYVFNQGYENTEIHKWWSRILSPLLKEGITEEMLRHKIMTIEYFPYHSKDWRRLPQVPSQQLAFDLVNEAIERGKTVVIMRSEDLWFDAVPALKDYENKMFIKNRRQPYVSANNLGEDNFNKVVGKLLS